MGNFKQTKKPFETRKVVGISMVSLGIFFVLCLVAAPILGVFGKAVSGFFLGIFGLTAYAILLAFTAAGFFIAFRKPISIPKLQAANLCVMYVIIVLLIHTIGTSGIAMNSFRDYIDECFSGTVVTFGGALAGIFTWPLYKAIKWGAYVFLLAVLIINVYIASDFFAFKKGRAVRTTPQVKNKPYVQQQRAMERPQGLSVFTVNNSFDFPAKNQNVSAAPQTMPAQSAASILFSQPQQKESSLYTARTAFTPSDFNPAQKSAYEQLYGKFDSSTMPSQSYNTDFEKSLSSSDGKKTFNTAPVSKFLDADVIPPKILHEESRSAEENKPIDITEKENKYLKASSKEKSDVAKRQLEMLKGKDGRGDIRPLEPAKRTPAKETAKQEPDLFKPFDTEPFMEESYLSHSDRIMQKDLKYGERVHHEVEQQEDLFAPFINYKKEPEQVAFAEDNVLERDEENAKTVISNTALSSDDEIDDLLTSMTSLLTDAQKVLEKDTVKSIQSNNLPPAPVAEKFRSPDNGTRETAKNTAAKEEKQKVKPVHKYKKYVRPTLDLLDKPAVENLSYNEDYDAVARQIEEVLAEFRIEAHAVSYICGPSVTLYEFELARGVSVKKILPLADDIAMRVSSKGGNVRIQAPIMGKNLFGIEVPNKKTRTVTLRSVIESSEFANAKGGLMFALGPNIQGENIIPDLSDMPHLLIGGATGFGKSVCLNCLVVSLMYRYSPEELRFIFVDPKQVELTMYNGLPHMLLPEVVTEPEKAIKTFEWLVNEMERRFTLFKEIRTDNIASYNEKVNTDTTQKLPRIVLIVDELANLMTYNKSEIENKILRLSQKARAAGIHLVLATQRPSKEVITGDIKVNLPCRIALKVVTVNDSRTIFPQGGPEKLAGKGDMLFLTGALPEPVRVQGAFVSKTEVDRVVNFIKDNNEAYFDKEVADEILKDKIVKDGQAAGEDTDPLFYAALKYCIEKKQASISMLQRRFKMGYNRAGKIIVEMERQKLISEQMDAKPRQIFITMDEFNELFEDAADYGDEEND